jgi:hypothetical protein
MAASTRLHLFTFSVLALPALAALVAGACGRARDRAPPPPLEGWDVPRLLAHLRASGLDLRAVPTDRDGQAARDRAFLTTADRPWEELNALLATPEQVGRWRGTVFCERLHQPGSRDEALRHWGGCGLRAGPFVLFGDPDLLDRVRAALAPEAVRAPPG